MFRGKAYNEIAVGDSFETAITVTETHLILGSGMFGDFNPLHHDYQFPQAKQLGSIIVHGRFKYAALGELVSGTLANIRATGPIDVLTGPIMRGDADTVARHLAALSPRDAATYVALARRTLDLVRERLGAGAIEEFEALFSRFS